MVVASVCGLRALQLDAVLLAVVTLVCPITVIAVVVVCCGRVRRCGCAVVVVVVVRLRVVSVKRSGSPAGAVEGCAAGLSPATGGDAAELC